VFPLAISHDDNSIAPDVLQTPNFITPKLTAMGSIKEQGIQRFNIGFSHAINETDPSSDSQMYESPQPNPSPALFNPV
jgi:hypothetical protein